MNSYSVTTHNFTGTLDGLALLDQTVRTEEHNTDLAGLEVHAHSLDARGEPVVVLVGSSFQAVEVRLNILDQLLGLDVGHTVHTGDTITVGLSLISLRILYKGMTTTAISSEVEVGGSDILLLVDDIPDRQDTASLSETGLLLDTSDALLENGGDLGRGGLFGVGSCLYRGDSGSSGACL